MDSVLTRPRAPDARDTLGPQVEEWMAENLVDFVTGDPLILTEEQSHFLWNLYRIDDHGRFVFDRAALVRARGTGKSPIAAYLAAAELCGPVRFGGWDEDGFPIGIPESAPLVQVIATTLAQCRPIFDALVSCWSEDALSRYALEISKEIVTKAALPRGKAVMVPNSPRALRGPRPSCVFIEESSEWVATNGGHEAMIRIRSNLAKHAPVPGRPIELCNPYNPGEDSLAERTHLAWVKQTSKPGARVSILYDWRAAPDGIDLANREEVIAGLRAAAGDATWLDVEHLADMLQDTSVLPATFRREHLAQLVTAEDSVLHPDHYNQCEDPTLRPLSPGDRIALGFDGSLSGDGTALVALRIEDLSFHLLHYDEPDPLTPDWRIDEGVIDQVVRSALATYKVVGYGSDVHPFDSWVYGWERDFGHTMAVEATSKAHPIARDMRTDLRGLTFSFMALVNEIESGRVVFSENNMMRIHWMNAKRRPNTHGFSFGKVTRHSTRRVDIVAASLLAYIVASKYLAIQPESPQRITAKSW